MRVQAVMPVQISYIYHRRKLFCLRRKKVQQEVDPEAGNPGTDAHMANGRSVSPYEMTARVHEDTDMRQNVKVRE